MKGQPIAVETPFICVITAL